MLDVQHTQEEAGEAFITHYKKAHKQAVDDNDRLSIRLIALQKENDLLNRDNLALKGQVGELTQKWYPYQMEELTAEKNIIHAAHQLARRNGQQMHIPGFNGDGNE